MKGSFEKVHGGAISAEEHSFNPEEQDVESKSKLLPMKSLQLRGFQHLLWMTAISFLSTPERLQAI